MKRPMVGETWECDVTGKIDMPKGETAPLVRPVELTWVSDDLHVVEGIVWSKKSSHRVTLPMFSVLKKADETTDLQAVIEALGRRVRALQAARKRRAG
jgi:hypothetical protein